MSTSTITHYETLGVVPSASHAVIRDAYRKLVKSSHPDVPGGDSVRFQAVQSAWEVLGDESAREMYDVELARQARQARLAAEAAEARSSGEAAQDISDTVSSSFEDAMAAVRNLSNFVADAMGDFRYTEQRKVIPFGLRRVFGRTFGVVWDQSDVLKRSLFGFVTAILACFVSLAAVSETQVRPSYDGRLYDILSVWGFGPSIFAAGGFACLLALMAVPILNYKHKSTNLGDFRRKVKRWQLLAVRFALVTLAAPLLAVISILGFIYWSIIFYGWVSEKFGR